MKLNLFLKENNITVRQFADSTQLSLDAVYKYMRGDRKPHDIKIMQRIATATDGAVTANDFYGIESKP